MGTTKVFSTTLLFVLFLIYDIFAVLGEVYVPPKKLISCPDIFSEEKISLEPQINDNFLIECLSERGKKLGIDDSLGYSSLLWAIRNDYDEVVASIKKAMLTSSLQFVCGQNSTDASNRSELVRLLVDLGADINKRDKANDHTPLVHSIFAGNTAITIALVEKGAALDIQESKGGWTALMLADTLKLDSVVSILLDRNASLDIMNNDNRTALDLAIISGRNETAKELIRRGANLELHDIEGLTLLMRTSFHGNIAITRVLLGHNISTLDAQDEHGLTALMWAAQYGRDEIALALIGAGANIDIQDSTGQTALMWVSGLGYSVIAKALIDEGADTEAVNSAGQTALALASFKGFQQIIEYLLDANANIHVRVNGWTPVMLAYIQKHLDVAQYLITNGASKDDLIALEKAVGKAKASIDHGKYSNNRNSVGF